MCVLAHFNCFVHKILSARTHNQSFELFPHRLTHDKYFSTIVSTPKLTFSSLARTEHFFWVVYIYIWLDFGCRMCACFCEMADVLKSAWKKCNVMWQLCFIAHPHNLIIFHSIIFFLAHSTNCFEHSHKIWTQHWQIISLIVYGRLSFGGSEVSNRYLNNKKLEYFFI